MKSKVPRKVYVILIIFILTVISALEIMYENITNGAESAEILAYLRSSKFIAAEYGIITEIAQQRSGTKFYSLGTEKGGVFCYKLSGSRKAGAVSVKWVRTTGKGLVIKAVRQSYSEGGAVLYEGGA